MDAKAWFNLVDRVIGGGVCQSDRALAHSYATADLDTDQEAYGHTDEYVDTNADTHRDPDSNALANHDSHTH